MTEKGLHRRVRVRKACLARSMDEMEALACPSHGHLGAVKLQIRPEALPHRPAQRSPEIRNAG